MSFRREKGQSNFFAHQVTVLKKLAILFFQMKFFSDSFHAGPLQ